MVNFACFMAARCAGTRVRVITGIALTALYGGCVDDHSVVDAISRDASSADGDADAALPDASAVDAESDDAGDSDASASDARTPDSHQLPEDAGPGALRCAEMAAACHPFDFGTGDVGSRCHQIGHAGNAGACTPELHQQCMAFCQLDSGAVADASSDAAEPPSDAASDAAPSQCEVLGHLCHDLDTGPDAGLAHECHEVGHAGDEAECAVIYSDCVSLCSADAAASDAG